jgi:hypothetical protein
LTLLLHRCFWLRRAAPAYTHLLLLSLLLSAHFQYHVKASWQPTNTPHTPGLDYTVAHYGAITKDPRLDCVLTFVDDREEADAADWGVGEVRLGAAWGGLGRLGAAFAWFVLAHGFGVGVLGLGFQPSNPSACWQCLTLHQQCRVSGLRFAPGWGAPLHAHNAWAIEGSNCAFELAARNLHNPSPRSAVLRRTSSLTRKRRARQLPRCTARCARGLQHRAPTTVQTPTTAMTAREEGLEKGTASPPTAICVRAARQAEASGANRAETRAKTRAAKTPRRTWRTIPA